MKPLIKLVTLKYTNCSTGEVIYSGEQVRICNSPRYKDLVMGELIDIKYLDYLINSLIKIKENLK